MFAAIPEAGTVRLFVSAAAAATSTSAATAGAQINRILLQQQQSGPRDKISLTYASEETQ